MLQTILRVINNNTRKNAPINPSKVLAEMARAALYDQDMDARAASLALSRWARHHSLSDIDQPRADHRTLVVCAALVELFAERLKQTPPPWSSAIGGLDTPFFFFPDARKDSVFGEALKRETPEPLRRRNLFSTSSYLQHV
jgi:hypothetical protein